MNLKFLPIKSAWTVASMLLVVAGGLIYADETDVSQDVTPVNLLEGSIKSTGTPADAGWIASADVTWLSARNEMDANGEYFRTDQKMSNGSVGSVFYPKSTNVVFGYPVDAVPGKVYKLNGILWKRNGGDETTTYTFGISKDVKNMQGAYTVDLPVKGNSVYLNLDQNLIVPSDFTTDTPIYFTWEVSKPANWQRGGLFENVSLTEIGDAAAVEFISDGTKVAQQYFLAGDNYTVAQPEEPVKKDYIFLGWFEDEDLTTKFDFTVPISQSKQVYAGWKKDYPNLADGWDGNGIGNNSDVPNQFGWTSTAENTVWESVQSGVNYHCYYRDNLFSGDKAARAIMHGSDTGIYAYPLRGMKKGVVYNVSLSAAFMNRAVITNYSVNTASDGSGDVLGSVSVNIPQWSSTTDITFNAIPREDGDFYFNWQSTDGGDRNILWNLTVREADNLLSAIFLNADGSVYSQSVFEKGGVVKAPSVGPVNDDKIFLGWYADEALTEPFDFNIARQEAVTVYPAFSTSRNYVVKWGGNGKGHNDDNPGNFGWYCTNPNVNMLAVENGYNDGLSCYYRDNLDAGGGTVRILMHGRSSDTYTFPIEGVKAGQGYVATAFVSEMNHDVTVAFGANEKQDASGLYYGRQTLTARDWNKEKRTQAKFYFVAPTDETCYLTWQNIDTGERAMIYDICVTEEEGLCLVTFVNADGTPYSYSALKSGESVGSAPVDPVNDDKIFIGWYTDENHTNAFDFNAPVDHSVTLYPYFYDGTVAETPVDRTITETTVLSAVANENIKVTSDAHLRLTSATPMLGNSFINLAGENNWLYVENMRPSKFFESYPDRVTVGNRGLSLATSDRIALYRNGFIIIPNGQLTVPVELYTGENLTGEMMECYQDIFYHAEELGEKFDNKIRSFKVRKGWQLCLANNSDGTGFSKIFIAADDDLIVNTMPEALEFASFARVSRFDWTGKKGYCNPGGLDVNIAWFYDWNIGGDSHQLDREYVAIRQNLGWPGWEDISNKENINTVLGQNEPDHTDQSNATVKQVIEQWHNMFKTGRRLGSPTPDSLNKGWLDQFIAAADSLNYRVDFVVAHMYWNSTSGSSLKNSIQEQSRRTGWRPVWITEMNNGANWTSEDWPDKTGAQRDADFNLILDDNGNEKTVNRPHTQANSDKQVAWFRDVLPALDDAPNLERYAFYNWVQDARAVELGGRLTPAGKVFDAHNSAVAYRSANAYDHKWHIAPPFPLASVSDDFSAAVISWYDHNGETGTNYIVEKRIDEGNWNQVAVLEPAKDYEYGATIEYTDPLDCNYRVDYRVKATSYKGGESGYSRFATIVRDNPSVPVLKAQVISSTKVCLTWEAASGVRAYRIERKVADKDEWVVVADNLTDFIYNDEELEPNVTYIYRLAALSTAINTPMSEEVTVTTPELGVPDAVTGLFVASGDNKVTLTWDYVYDTYWDVRRAVKKTISETMLKAKASDEFEIIATGLTESRFTDVDVTNGVEYVYMILPYNDKYYGFYSDIVEAIPTSGRCIYYPFDEAEGDMAHDHHGGYHGKLVNNAKWTDDRNGNPGKAVALAKDDKAHVQLADGLMDEMEDFTIATWVKFTGTYARLVDFGQGTGNFLILAPSKDKIRYKLTCAAGTCDVTVRAELPANEWLHIAVTQGDNMRSRAGGKTLTFYVNGTEVAQGNNEDGVTPADMGHSTANYLGRSQWTNDSYADHEYDDMYVVNRALSSDEVQSLYANNEVGDSGDVSGVASAELSGVKAFVENNEIVIVASETALVKVYNAEGRMVTSVRAFPGKTVVKELSAGVYVVNNTKLLIK